MQHRKSEKKQMITLQRQRPFIARPANAPRLLFGHQMDCIADQHIARPPASVHISKLVPYCSYSDGPYSNKL
eukprot:scaffold588991_cov19-Prasinocladus_malaysianus.AAC.1